MRSLNFFVTAIAFLVNGVLVVEGTERRTCERQIEYTVTVPRWWPLSDQVVLKTRTGLFCCIGYNPIHDKSHHFIEVRSKAECVPFCYPHCPANSFCLPPKTCECQDTKFYAKHYVTRCKCNEGFVPTENGQCSPICPDHCTNGNCNGLSCTCTDGYKVNDLQKCVPECEAGCKEDQECTSPGKCTPKSCTEPGYERNELNECLPKCQNDCLNGNCTAPGNCTCNEGYQKNTVNQTCEAKCENCTNGFCMFPQKCVCNMGFEDEAGVCVETIIAEESSEDVKSTRVWLVLGLCLGLAVVVTVAVVGCLVTRRIISRNKSNAEASIELKQVPRPMLQLPENDEEEICVENDLYGRF